MSDADIESFLHFSAGYSNINALTRDWQGDFAEAIDRLRIDAPKESFRRGFAKSLLGELTPAKYEHVTGWDFDTEDELHEHLTALWRRFYGDADPRDSLT